MEQGTCAASSSAESLVPSECSVIDWEGRRAARSAIKCTVPQTELVQLVKAQWRRLQTFAVVRLLIFYVRS